MLKQISSVIFSVTITVMIMFASAGCTSYRVVGKSPNNLAASSVRLQRTYRLERIKVNYDSINGMPSHVWNMSFALGKFPVNDFEERIIKKRPEVFVENPNSIPIVAEVNLKSGRGSLYWTALVPYLVSLGILPAQIQYDDVCGVTIQRRDTMYQTPETTFSFQHKCMVTALSPIGLIGYDNVPDTTACSSGSGIILQPALDKNVRDNIADAISTTLAATIVSLLQQMEIDEQLGSPQNQSNVAIPTATQIPVPQSQPMTNTDLSDQIRKLKELRDAGTITEKEYQDMVLRATERVK